MFAAISDRELHLCHPQGTRVLADNGVGDGRAWPAVCHGRAERVSLSNGFFLFSCPGLQSSAHSPQSLSSGFPFIERLSVSSGRLRSTIADLLEVGASFTVTFGVLIP